MIDSSTMVIDLSGINPGSSKTAIEETRRLIDQNKIELHEAIRQLNSKRNDLSPISVLPPELLARIFTFLTEGYPGAQADSFMFDFTSRMNFTHVSQKWRNVALDTPHLWDTPSFEFPTWARAMLERSKMVDLVIDADASGLSSPSLMKEVFDNHAARIREINLRGLSASFLSSILEPVQSSSLRLRALQLSTHDWLDDDEVVVFPAHLLAYSNSLQHLAIDRCAFDWCMQPHPLLTYLMIQDTRDRPLLSEFVTALSGMPTLETLEMVDSLPFAIEAINSGQKVMFSKLSYLRLSSSQSFFEVLNVLDLLVVPCSTRVNLSCFEASQPDIAAQPSDVGPRLDAFFSCMTGNGERESYIRLHLHSDGGGIGLLAWKKDGLSNSIDLPDLSLAFNHLGRNYRPNELLDEIYPCLPLFDLRTLKIDTDLRQDPIHKDFGQSTTIQNVELAFSASVRDFMRALAHKPEGYEYSRSAYHSVTFPALQSLDFNRKMFTHSILDEVLDCLMERCERGAGLQKLSIRDCYFIDEDDVLSLRGIVTDVEWDGLVQIEEADDDTSDSVGEWIFN